MTIDYSIIKTAGAIKKIEKSCLILVKVLKKATSIMQEGVKAEEIEQIVLDVIKNNNAIPGFKSYQGFPYATCLSINNEVIHGFPANKILHKNDIVTIDSGVLLDGYNSDSATTIIVAGQETKLLKATRSCIKKGIAVATHGNKVGDISNAIETEAHKYGFNVVEDFVGHGIGKELHEFPQIYNFGKAKTGYLLRNGMVICIEPILVEKNNKVKYLPNKWTVVTEDDGLSAHFEHVVVINNNNPVVLTEW